MLSDLQVHTPADREHRYGDVGGPEPNPAFARVLVKAHADAGVKIMAVTDHNRIDWWPVLHEAGQEFGVFVFPGMEINVNKCHLLMIWERDEEGYSLARRFLEGLFEPGIKALGSDRQPKPVLDGSPLTLATTASNLRALVLAPHATANGIGLFGRNVCNTSDEVAQSGLVLGFDVIGNTTADVLINPRSQFRDVRPSWFVSGDTRAIQDVGTRCTYLKTGPVPTLESVRQAFLMPATRVRFPTTLRENWKHVVGAKFLASEKPVWPHISSVAVEGGFHAGLKVEFGPGLNAVIGGKGTGKSTLVEILRYVLGAPASIAPMAQAKEGLSNLDANFPANAEAEVQFQAADGDRYTIKRVGNSPSSQLSRGSAIIKVGLDRRVRVQVFGQRELAELHQDRDALENFISSRRADEARAADQLVREALDTAHDLGKKLNTVDESLKSTAVDLDELSDVNDRLARLAAAGAEGLLKASALLSAAESSVDQLAAWPDAVGEAIVEFAAAAEAPIVADHALIPDVLKSIGASVRVDMARSVEELVDQNERRKAALTAALPKWREVAAAERESLGRKLADAGIRNPEELSRLQRKQQELDRKVQGVEVRELERDQLVPLRAQSLAELARVRRARSRINEDAIRDLNDRSGEHVRIVISPLAVITPLVDFLGSKVMARKLGGDQIIRLKKITPQLLSEAVGLGKAALVALGLPSAMSDRLLQLPLATLRELEELDTPDEIHVELRRGTATEPLWSALDDVSPGQAATAMLSLALVGGDEPLIIDQPEDDLDNRYIYSDVVRQLAEVGSQRQVIVATHNANIPVLGDAELVVAFEASSGRATVLACGGLDELAVADTARNILEGGADAFRARARRYREPVYP